jgi:hypothetical protein
MFRTSKKAIIQGLDPKILNSESEARAQLDIEGATLSIDPGSSEYSA